MNTNTHNAKFRIGFGIGPIIALMFLSALVVQAQDPAQLKQMFARSQQQNAQALKQYVWKSRNEVRRNGESKATQIFLMRYDDVGNIQKSQIGGSAPPSLPTGPILGRIAQRKKEDFLDLMNDLRERVTAYSHLSPERMQAFLGSATILAKLDQGLVQIRGENILHRGDSMSIWVDARSRKQRRVEIDTFLENNLVKAVIEFSDLPAGPTYMARTLVQYPKEDLQLITENYDYQRERINHRQNRWWEIQTKG